MLAAVSDGPELELMHVPFIEKQPARRLKPFAAEEVAVELVMLRTFAASPPEKVEVEFVPTTFKNPWTVEVPVVLPWIVVVALLPTKSVPKID